MNIIYVVSFSLTGCANGISQYVLNVASNMARRGHKVAVLTYGDITNIKLADNVTYMEIESFHYPPVKIARMSNSNLEKIASFLNEFNPNIVHVNLFSQIDFYVSNWAKKNHIPLAYTIHLLPSSLMSFASISKITKKVLNSRMVRGLSRGLYTGYDFMIAPNDIAKQDITDLKIKVPTEVVNNGFDGGILKRSRRYRDGNKKKLLYVGGGHIRKNQLFLIKALSHLDNSYELTLIGRFDKGEYLNTVHGYLTKHNITNVNFLGFLPHDKVIDEMFKNDIFVSASKVEVQSLVVLEALATGLPIVALSNETTSELINDENGRCLEIDSSAEQFAIRVKEIAEVSDDKYKMLSQGAKDRVRNMTWEEGTKKLESIYVKYVKEHKLKKSGVLGLLSFIAIVMSRALFFKIRLKRN